MPIVGSHQQAPVTIPINGTAPVDADEVRLNDNAIIANYNAHDNDATIHYQSSSLATRPLPGTAGRLWLVTDDGQLYRDTGTQWVTVKGDASSLTTGTVPTARVVGAYDNITSVGTLDDLAVTGNATAGSFTGPLTGNVTGDVTGNVTGNVSGNAGTATALSSARTFALTGDVTGTVSSDLTSGATITTAYTAAVPATKGGTGLTSTPANGQLPIGNGSGYTLATITAGNNITVTNTAGSITLDVVGQASGVSGSGTGGTVPRLVGTGTVSQLGTGTIQDNGTEVAVAGAPEAGVAFKVHGDAKTTGDMTVGDDLVVTGNNVSVNGVTYTYPSTQGTADTVLVNNGSGTLTWRVPALIDASIAPTSASPYYVSASDVNKRLVMTTTGSAGAVVVAETGSLATGSKIGLFSTGNSTTLQFPLVIPSYNPNINSGVNVVVQQSDGKLLLGGAFTTVGGTTRNRMARLNTDGSLDTGFNPNVNDQVYAIAIQSDGKILIGGAFTTVGGTTRQRMARLNADGTLDTSFVDPAITTAGSRVEAIAIQSDGKAIVVGSFQAIGAGTRLSGVARVNTDGTLDTGYAPGGTTANATAVIIQPSDGKAIVYCPAIGASNLVRLNTNGTTDGTYTPNVNGNVQFLQFLPSGQLLIGGQFTSVGGSTRNYVARLNADGTLDTAFNANISTVGGSAVRAVAVQPDGKYVIGGSFATVGSSTRNNLVRVTATGAVDPMPTQDPNVSSTVFAIVNESNSRSLIFGSFTTVSSYGMNRGARVLFSDNILAPYAGYFTVPQYGNIVLEKTATDTWVITESNCS